MIDPRKILTFRRLIFGVIVICLLALFFLDPAQFGRFADPDFLNRLSGGDFSPATVFFILAASTLISEDLACITAGTLAARGEISFLLAAGACFTGIFIGDILLFVIGRVGGRKILEYRLTRRFLSEEVIGRASHFLERYGLWTVFLSRFTFGLRLPIYFLAGVLRTSFWKFTLYFFLATIVWTPLLVGASAWLGREFFESPFFGHNFLISLVIFVLSFFLLLRFVLKMLDWSNRRIFLGKIKRIWNWEFWPLKVFYAPVFFYILGLGLKHRGVTVFTAANPAIHAGGFVGESKEQILRGLVSSAAARELMLKFTLLEAAASPEENLQRARRFVAANGLSFPVVVKPDVGERGKGIEFIRNLAELEQRIAAAEEDLILQEYAGGEEVSIFYCRYPQRAAGRIFSITEKRFPAVTGDGESDLEELILQDDRAICLAETYFEQNRERLFEVPARGEKIRLVGIGTHSRGAVFLDGDRFKTPELEQQIDRICRGYPGFYFGRFDIRTGSIEDLRRGENFKIVELNGVTSESTNIYDPRHSLFSAYRILFKQWRIAFEIGAENRENGAETASFSELAKMIFAHLAGRGPVKTERQISTSRQQRQRRDAEI